MCVLHVTWVVVLWLTLDARINACIQHTTGVPQRKAYEQTFLQLSVNLLGTWLKPVASPCCNHMTYHYMHQNMKTSQDATIKVAAALFFFAAGQAFVGQPLPATVSDGIWVFPIRCCYLKAWDPMHLVDLLADINIQPNFFCIWLKLKHLSNQRINNAPIGFRKQETYFAQLAVFSKLGSSKRTKLVGEKSPRWSSSMAGNSRLGRREGLLLSFGPLLEAHTPDWYVCVCVRA